MYTILEHLRVKRDNATDPEKSKLTNIMTHVDQDGKDYEIVVPPEDNYFDGINFYYKCFIAVKEKDNDPD